MWEQMKGSSLCVATMSSNVHVAPCDPCCVSLFLQMKPQRGIIFFFFFFLYLFIFFFVSETKLWNLEFRCGFCLKTPKKPENLKCSILRQKKSERCNIWWILCKDFRSSEVWSRHHWRSPYNSQTSSNIYVICTFIAKILAKCTVQCAYCAIFYLKQYLVCLPNIEHSRCPNRKTKNGCFDHRNNDATSDESLKKT